MPRTNQMPTNNFKREYLASLVKGRWHRSFAAVTEGFLARTLILANKINTKIRLLIDESLSHKQACFSSRSDRRRSFSLLSPIRVRIELQCSKVCASHKLKLTNGFAVSSSPLSTLHTPHCKAQLCPSPLCEAPL